MLKEALVRIQYLFSIQVVTPIIIIVIVVIPAVVVVVIIIIISFMPGIYTYIPVFPSP